MVLLPPRVERLAGNSKDVANSNRGDFPTVHGLANRLWVQPQFVRSSGDRDERFLRWSYMFHAEEYKHGAAQLLSYCALRTRKVTL